MVVCPWHACHSSLLVLSKALKGLPSLIYGIRTLDQNPGKQGAESEQSRSQGHQATRAGEHRGPQAVHGG